MILKEAFIHAFGKFSNAKFKFSSGLNIVFGQNESGKSTLREYIFGMFYGQKKYGVKKRIYLPANNLFTPWNNNKYKGILKYSVGDKDYRIERNFHSKFEDVKLFEEKTGIEVTDDFPMDNRKEVQFFSTQIGINERIFKNTILVEESEMAGLLYKNQERIFEELLGRVVYGIDKKEEKTIRQMLNDLEKKKKEIGTKNRSKSPLGQAYSLLEEKNQKKILLETKKENYYTIKSDLDNISIKEEKITNEENTLFLQEKIIVKESIEKKIKFINNLLEEKKDLEIYINTNFHRDISQLNLENMQREKDILFKKQKKAFVIGLISSSMIVLTFLWLIIWGLVLWIHIPLMIVFLTSASIGIYRWYFIKRLKEKMLIKIENANKYQEAKNEMLGLKEKVNLELLEYSLEELNIKLELLKSETKELKEINKQPIGKYDIEIQLKELRSRKDNLFKEKTLAEFKLKEHSWDSKEMEEVEQDIHDIKSSIQSMEDDIQAIEIVMTTFHQLIDNKKIKWMPLLIKQAEENIYKITKKYSTIKIDDNYQMKTLEPSTEKLVSMDQLSRGTFYQFYFSLRLSFIQILSKNSFYLPIILDEPFIHFDNIRFEESMELLKDLSKRHQVIIFTNQQREKNYLKNLKDSYNYIELKHS